MMPAGKRSLFQAGICSSCRRAIRCFISSNACATRRIVLPSARTGRAANAISAKPVCSANIGARAYPCFGQSARLVRIRMLRSDEPRIESGHGCAPG